MSRFIDDLTDSYIESMLWANTYTEGETGELEYDESPDVDILDVRQQCPSVVADAAAFFDTALDRVTEVYGEDSPELEAFHGITAERMGHDFALTRNRHGAGFWDRGYGPLGDTLTEVAEGFGESTLFVSHDDDGEPVVHAE